MQYQDVCLDMKRSMTEHGRRGAGRELAEKEDCGEKRTDLFFQLPAGEA